MFSCGYKSEIERLQEINDSLAQVSGGKDETITEFIAGYNEIQENLRKIKEKEDIIRSKTSAGDEMGQSAKDEINEDILTIYELMLQNKQKAESLERKLSASKSNKNELQNMLKSLNEQISSKDSEIEKLKEQLAQMNIDIENLNTQVTELSSDVDSLSEENREKAREIQEKTSALNTGYYVFGTKKELIEKEVITKEGGFIGIGRMEKLREDFNKDYFTKTDIRELDEILLSAKKAEVITNHPAGTYKLVENDNGVEKLKITDNKKFWSVSKYLVIIID